MVPDEQLSLAIGRRGQNVRLASQLTGWDIDIMTVDELARDLEKAERWFSAVPGMASEMIEVLITEGFFTYTDLTFLEPEQLSDLIGVAPEEADEMIMFAEEMAERIEREGEPEYEAQVASEEQQATEDTETVTEGEAVAEDSEAAGEAPAVTENSGTPVGSFDSLFQADAAPTDEAVAPAEGENSPPSE